MRKTTQHPAISLLYAAGSICLAVYLFRGIVPRSLQILLGIIMSMIALNDLLRMAIWFLEKKLEREKNLLKQALEEVLTGKTRKDES